MLGDILLIRRHHKKAAATLAGILAKTPLARPVIAISGESGSGKSELGNTLARQLKSAGKKAKVVTTDDFYLTLPSERTAKRLEKGIAQSVGPQEYDWDALDRIIGDFRKKRKSVMPCVDLLNDQVDRLHTDFRGIDVLILEGLYAIRAADADLRVLIDIPYTLTKLAQTRRMKEPMDPTRLEILRAEHRAVEKIKPLAGVRIDVKYRVHAR